MTKIIAQNKQHLQEIISIEIEKYGNNCDLNHINTSKIKDMSGIFYNSDFEGYISKWDTSNVKNMSAMFGASRFSGDISKWNTSNVENMAGMFYCSRFNNEISLWNICKVVDMTEMFYSSQFTHNVDSWKPYSLELANNMFAGYNKPLPHWYSYTLPIGKSLRSTDLKDMLDDKLINKKIESKIKI